MERRRVAALGCLADPSGPFDRELAVLPDSGLQRLRDGLFATGVIPLGVAAVVDLPAAALRMDANWLEFSISQMLSQRANPTLALHIEAMTNVRILLEHELHFGEWECERAIAQRLARAHGRFNRGHLPDGILHQDGERIAIEVELSVKSRARLREIAEETSSKYDRVWYFVKPKLVPLLRKIAAENLYPNIAVCVYPPTADDAYSL